MLILENANVNHEFCMLANLFEFRRFLRNECWFSTNPGMHSRSTACDAPRRTGYIPSFVRHAGGSVRISAIYVLSNSTPWRLTSFFQLRSFFLDLSLVLFFPGSVRVVVAVTTKKSGNGNSEKITSWQLKGFILFCLPIMFIMPSIICFAGDFHLCSVCSVFQRSLDGKFHPFAFLSHTEGDSML